MLEETTTTHAAYRPTADIPPWREAHEVLEDFKTTLGDALESENVRRSLTPNRLRLVRAVLDAAGPSPPVNIASILIDSLKGAEYPPAPEHDPLGELLSDLDRRLQTEANQVDYDLVTGRILRAHNDGLSEDEILHDVIMPSLALDSPRHYVGINLLVQALLLFLRTDLSEAVFETVAKKLEYLAERTDDPNSPPPWRSEDEVLEDFRATLLNALEDESVRRASKPKILRLVGAIAEASRVAPALEIAVFLKMTMEGPEGSAAPPNVDDGPLDRILEDLHMRLLNESNQMDIGRVRESHKQARAVGMSNDEIFEHVVLPAVARDTPKYYTGITLLLFGLRVFLKKGVHEVLLDNAIETLEDTAAAGPEGESAERLIHAFLGKARRVLADRRAIKPLKPYEVKFARTVVDALELGVDPVLLAGITHSEDTEYFPHKPQRRMPIDFMEIGKPVGGLLALQGASDEEVVQSNHTMAAVMGVAITLRLSVPRRIIEEKTRVVEELIREAEAGFN